MTNIAEIRKICTQFHIYSISNYIIIMKQLFLYNKFTLINVLLFRIIIVTLNLLMI